MLGKFEKGQKNKKIKRGKENRLMGIKNLLILFQNKFFSA